MEYLFPEPVWDWESWERVSAQAKPFLPLLRRIFAQTGIPETAEVSGPIPCTNAVFFAGEAVVKLFAPEPSGICSRGDYEAELSGLERARSLGLPVPRLAGHGVLRDRYAFYYLVTERVAGMPARQVLPDYDGERAADFAGRVLELLLQIRAGAPQPVSPLLLPRTLENGDWNQLAPSLAGELHEAARRQDLTRSIWVHGDLNGGNVLVGPGGEIAVIDFADSIAAPPWYDLPSVLLDLFEADRRFTLPFREGYPGNLAEDLPAALSLHDFAPDLLVRFFRAKGIGVRSVKGLAQLRELLETHLF